MLYAFAGEKKKLFFWYKYVSIVKDNMIINVLCVNVFTYF